MRPEHLGDGVVLLGLDATNHGVGSDMVRQGGVRVRVCSYASNKEGKPRSVSLVYKLLSAKVL